MHESAQIQALAWRISRGQQASFTEWQWYWYQLALTEPSMRHAELQSPNDKTQIKSEQASNIYQKEAWSNKAEAEKIGDHQAFNFE